ncbi:MAG: hypothetical protein WCG91_02635 [Candidatus Shapirobacteria bacterium]
MIYIFHGDNQFDSRSAFNDLIEKYIDADLLKVDGKNINPEIINNFLQSNSLLNDKKVLILSNLFSAPKTTLDKLPKILNQLDNHDIIVWQDKKLNPTQLKTFPQAKVQVFQLDSKLFTCLNAIKPQNLKTFIPLYEEMLKQGIYDLFLYLLKGNLRKQLTSYTRFDKAILKRAYLQLIELDYQNKSGQLAIPKELALERIIINLIK